MLIFAWWAWPVLYAYRRMLVTSRETSIQAGVSALLCKFFGSFQKKPLKIKSLDPHGAPESPWGCGAHWELPGASEQEVPHSLDIAPGVEMSIKVCVGSGRIGSGFTEVRDLKLSLPQGDGGGVITGVISRKKHKAVPQ